MTELYERYSEGDLERVLDLWTDDFVWVGDDSGLPGSGRHEGKQAAIGVLQEALGANDKKYERPPGNSLNRAIRSSCSGTKKVQKGIGQCVCHSPISGAFAASRSAACRS